MKKRKNHKAKIRIHHPRWIMLLYLVQALVLIPWIIWMGYSLPAHHVVRNWGMVWVGFDLTILTAVIVTVWSFVKKYPSTALFASSLATLLVVDTWFDVMTAHAGKERSQALLLAVVELGMAIFTYKLAYTALRALPAKD